MAAKRPRVSQTAVDADRISSLPDGVLSHILFFLRTDDSVRTRVLSTRWKHLFSLVPTIDFYFHPQFPISTQPERIERLLDLVDWVFASYNAGHMFRFLFSCAESLPDSSRLLSWISKSVNLGVQELMLDVSLPEPQNLPHSIFTCHTITRLSLNGLTNNTLILDIPQDVCLPRVRELDLISISFVDSDSARRLFPSCPVLEELCLKSVFTGDIYTLDISVPTLKKFTFSDGYKDIFNLVLDVPNLEKFYYTGGVMQHGSFSIQSLKVLSEACINFTTLSSEGYKALENLVSAVCQVKKLQFRESTLQIFQSSGRSFPLFCNLTNLEIENISMLDSEALLDLLDRTPHLEVLDIDNCGFSAEDYDESIYDIHFSEERVPACVSLHLKEVRFGSFIMLENEFKLVDYLLKNAKVLNTFKICFWGSLEKQLEMSKKLLTFSRSSKACQIELNLDTEDLEIEDLDRKEIDREDLDLEDLDTEDEDLDSEDLETEDEDLDSEDLDTEDEDLDSEDLDTEDEDLDSEDLDTEDEDLDTEDED